MFSDATVFVDHNVLKDIGYWSELFRDNPRTIPIYCDKCKCQRMHSKVGMPVKQLIHDGKKWKDIIVGFYFECTYCKEKYLEYYNHKIDPVAICPVCGTAYKKREFRSCPVCETNHNWELLTNESTDVHAQKIIPNDSSGKLSKKQITHIRFLEKLVQDIIWEWPDENVIVDKKNKCIVWNSKRGDI